MGSSDIKKSSKTNVETNLALLRLSRNENLEPETISLVRDAVARSLGLVDNVTTQSKAGATHCSNESSEDHTPSTLTPQMRHLIAGGAPWHVIAKLLWKEFNEDPKPSKAARLLETAFLEADPAETLAVFTRLAPHGIAKFYWNLHPKLRNFIIENAPEQHVDHLHWIIARATDAGKLTGLELAYLFLRSSNGSDKTASWQCFKQHQAKILDSFNGARHFSITKQQLIVKACEVALSIGQDADVRNLLQLLPYETVERESVLQNLLKYESHQGDKTYNNYQSAIENTPDWKDRLRLVSHYCDQNRSNGPNRASLDILLKNILQWVPKNPEAWRIVGDLIMQHRDISTHIPGILQPLYTNAVIFHGPDFDGQLWYAASNITPKNKIETFLHATALLHKYVTNPRLGESLLWGAKDLLENRDFDNNTNLPWTWKDLVKTAYHWATHTSVLVDRDKQRVLSSLRLAQDGKLASQETVNSYMMICTPMPTKLIQAIAKNAAASNKYDFAANLIVSSGHTRRFTNDELTELWSLSAGNSNPDFSWRVATILSSREALPKMIQHTWEISGERRASYSPTILTNRDIECAMAQLSSNFKRIGSALCIAGARINELAQINGASSQQSPAICSNSILENGILTTLKSSKVIPKGSKIILEARGIHMIPEISAPLAQSLVSGPWLFAVRVLAERLSLPTWGWNLSTLRELTKTVLPQIGRESTTISSPKLAKWLLSLSSQERAAVSEIANGSKWDSNEMLEVELTKFVCRLGLLLYPSHLLALKTLHQLRCSLDVIHDLEWFILSKEMSEFRATHQITNRVAIPHGLKGS